GVASTIQNRPSNPDGEYLPPMPWRCIDYIIQKGAEKIGVPYLPDRCAQLTTDHNNHPACHYCGNCSRGCDVGSFFSPTWFTIPEAEATKNLTLLTNSLVRGVLVDESGMAKGVAFVDRKTRKEVEVYAKVVVLAASCVETAHIMLDSKSPHWPTGIANSSVHPRRQRFPARPTTSTSTRRRKTYSASLNFGFILSGDRTSS